MFQLSFKKFIVFFLVLVSIVTFLFIFFASIGMLFQFLLYILVAAVALPIVLRLSTIEKVGKRIGTKFAEADEKEIWREDDVLLQAIPFSSAILFFFVNMALQDESAKVVFSFFIVIFTIPFYIVRAWAKIKDSPKYRYHSMNILAFLISIMVSSFFTTVFELSIPKEFFQIINWALSLISICIFLFLFSLAQTVFKKRYRYKEKK
jgi:hypothetical protein